MEEQKGGEKVQTYKRILIETTSQNNELDILIATSSIHDQN